MPSATHKPATIIQGSLGPEVRQDTTQNLVPTNGLLQALLEGRPNDIETFSLAARDHESQ
ncbi:hypothetical protein BGZ65_007658, partial [Modicella reniformis]